MSPPPSGIARHKFLEDVPNDDEQEFVSCRKPYDDFEEMDDDTRDMDGYDEQDIGDVDGDYYNEDDDCIGDDYADDDWESSYGSSEADSDYHHLWPDPFEEGTQASSAPRSPTPSMAGEATAAIQAPLPLGGVGLCWQADDADLISDGLKVLCLSRPPHWRDGPPEVRREPSDESIRSCYDHSRAAGDFRRCPEEFWAALHQKAGWTSGPRRNEAAERSEPVNPPPTSSASSKAGQCPGKTGRRLVYTRQRGSLRPRPPPARPERRSGGPRCSRPQAATKAGAASASLLRPSKEDAGTGIAPEEARAKTPFYEVTEEEFERLWLSGAVDGASEVEDEVYEISEEDFDRLLKAGQLQLARLEAMDSDASAMDIQARRPTKRPRPRGALPDEVLVSSLPTPLVLRPPPLTAPSAPARRSSEPAPRRRRPRTVDGSETKKAFTGFRPLPAERTPRGEVAQRTAAGSPARLLRSLRASISGSVVPLTEAEEQGEIRVARRLPVNGRLPRISLPNTREALRKSNSCSGTDAGGESDMSSPSPVLLPSRSPATQAE